MEKTVEENKMGTMPVGRMMVKLSSPLVLSMMFLALYNIVDSIFVARLNQDALNAVSLAFPLQSLVMAFAVGTGVGMGALLSRALGEKNYEAADRAANTGIFLYICTSAVFLLGSIFAARPYFLLLTDNPRIIEYGTDYVHICIGCAFASCFETSGGRLLQSTGKTGLSMIAQISSALINIILDPILIFGLLGFPKLEVKGAAIATVTSQIVSGVISYTLNAKKNTEIHIIPKKIRFHKETVKEIYRVGFPSIIMQSLGSIMSFTINNILIGFTEAATAVFGAYYRVQSFVFMPVFGMNTAIVPMISYNYGAKKYGRVKKIVRLGIIGTVGIMTLGCIIFETVPELLIKMFSPTEEMIAVGKVAFRILAIQFPFAGVTIIAGSACQALGRPRYSLITVLCRQLVVLLPAAYLFSLSGKVDLVWLAFPVAELISVTLSAIFLAKTIKLLPSGNSSDEN